MADSTPDSAYLRAIALTMSDEKLSFILALANECAHEQRRRQMNGKLAFDKAYKEALDG